MGSRYDLISAEKRILLYLLDNKGSNYKEFVSTALTQNGIANDIGIHRNYISRPLKKLREKGLIKESVGRIERGKKRQKYYLLTKEGKKYSIKLKDELSNLQINLHPSDSSTKSMALKDISDYLDKHKICSDVTEHDIYGIITRDHSLSIDILKNIKKIRFIDYSSEAPLVMHFFGRKREMKLLDKWIEDEKEHNIISILGMAGIGKTTLAAKLIEKYKGNKHLFWHTFHNLDTLRGILIKVAEFLSEMDQDHLEFYMRTRTSLDYYEVAKILKKNIGDIDAVFIFDDFHKSSDKIREFFTYFLRMLACPSKTKIIILSREIVPFYDRRDVLASEIVAELELEGLDFESSKKLLRKKGIDKSMFKRIYGLTAGNPLFIEFLESEEHLERYMHDELFLKLEENERRILGIISVYRFPIPKDSLLLVNDFDFEKLYILTQKSIVKKDAGNRYFLHDIIRQFFYSRLSPSTRERHHLLAARWYENRDDPIDKIEALYHYLEGGEHEKAAKFAIDSSSTIIDGGYAGEFLKTLEKIDETDVGPDIWSELLIIKGKACYMGGEWKKALLNFTESADIASLICNNELIARAICETGHILEEQNQFDKALLSFNKCLHISKESDYHIGIGRGYRGIGRVFWRKENRKEAIENFRKCLEISEKIGDLELMASTYIDLGNVYDEMYETEKAIECYNKSLDILNKCMNTYEIARAYGNLAITYRHIDKFKSAIKYHEKQLELAENLRDMRSKGYALAGLGICFAKVNEFEKAQRFVEKAEDIALKIDNENIMNMANRALSLICKHEGRINESADYLKRCIEYLNKLRASYQLPDSHFELGLLYEEVGDIKNVKKHFKIATKLYSELGLGNTKYVRDKLAKYQ